MSKHKPTADAEEPGDSRSGRGSGGGSGGGRPRSSARDQARVKIAREAKRRREQRIIFLVAGVVVLALIGGGIGLQLWRSRKAPDTASSNPSSTSIAQLDAQSVPVNGKPLTLGRSDAAVTVTLYEDFHCPHCAEFEERYGSVLTDAQLAGRIKIELYPMAFINAGSARASSAMACAADAGFPQSYYLGLFANPTLDWNTDQLTQLAPVVGATATAEFTGCVTNGSYGDWVTSINTAANQNGVTSTPTMFIDGQAVDISTLTSPDTLKSLIDAAAAS